MENYLIKEKNSDFQVTEILDLNLNGGNYHYYLLHKCGIRTVDAINSICLNSGINNEVVSYAGLKDEDAVTSQYISVYGMKIENQSYHGDNGDYYHMNYVGSSGCGIKIGNLHGNAFKIKLRGLEHKIAEEIGLQEKRLVPIINYYGIQRFGKPDMPKLTHLIGEALLANDYSKAFDYMHLCGNITDETYDEWKGNCDRYIISASLRELNFYLSAWDSYLWNNAVMEVIKNSGGSFEVRNQYDVPYIFIAPDMDISKRLEKLCITRHEFTDNYMIVSHNSFRQPVIPLIYRASDIEMDKLHAGKYTVQLSFTMPSGSYATTAVEQIVWNINNKSSGI